MTTTSDAGAAPAVPKGLKGVPVTDTRVGDVRGREGFYHYRQYSAVELAERRSLEDVWQLLIDGDLPPDTASRNAFADAVKAQRELPAEVARMLPAVAAASCSGGALDGLRSAVSLLGSAYGMRP